MSAFSNTTALMSPQDVLMAFPRMLARAGLFAYSIPEKMDNMFGLANSGSIIAEATSNGSKHMISAALSEVHGAGAARASQGVAETAPAAAAAAAEIAPSKFSLGILQMQNLGGPFAYMTSRWALTCTTLALILNRTQVYASPRRRVDLTWYIRVILRILPTALFVLHTYRLLQALRCQTSPNYPDMRYGDRRQVDADFSGEGGFLYHLSSTLLFFQGEQYSCRAVNMIPLHTTEAWERRGSLSLLWPFFQTLCLGQFVDTLSCALSGRSPMTETGMSIFEHSLAFAEAEGMLSQALGISTFGFTNRGMGGAKFVADGEAIVTSNELFKKLNCPPEVLLLGAISSLNNLSAQVLGIWNKQNRFRLLNTGIWGVCFMSAFIWGFFNIRRESAAGNIVFRIPTVCIVGFVPHFLIIIGMIFCAVIYALAVLLCFLSPSPDSTPRNLRERFQMACENMQANAQISSIRVAQHEDFYTALLKIGFSALTVASEAVYLNEGRKITVAPLTWLEEERMMEIEAFGQVHDPVRDWSAHVHSAQGNEKKSMRTKAGQWQSGYARHTDVKDIKTARAYGRGADGVGHIQKGGRYFMAYEFLEAIFWLFLSWQRILANKSLDMIGIAWRPRLLQASSPKHGVETSSPVDNEAPAKSMDFWMLSDEGSLFLPEDDNVDVEQETRKRLENADDGWEDVPGSVRDETLDTKLYEWWKHNGWWGEKDSSGSFAPSTVDEDDTTSVISASTAQSVASFSNDDNDDELDSGRSTPTQRHHLPQHQRHNSSRASTSFTDHSLSPTDLARLLSPTTLAEREEAHLLAHHLNAPTITTRAQYASALSSRNTRLLTSTRHRPPHSSIPVPTAATGPLSSEEETHLLEQMILDRRSRRLAKNSSNGSTTTPDRGESWRDGGDGAGSGGPQCVVCQSSPRTVLAWPCRCLSLCEECRVSLAMNNFATCVCCRRDVVGFSRLYVP